MMTLNSLSVADSVVIPVQVHYLLAKSMTQLLRIISKVKRCINPDLAIDGILLTIVDNRTKKYAKQYGISEYVELIKAVMMQEGGGKSLDPMQAAEGSFNTRYPHKPNGIQDPEYSIKCGVRELKAALISAGVENPIDMERIKLALQGYNFGNGYISWAKTNYGGYSHANAVEFSTQQAQRLGWDSYGDTQYPAHVLRYYPYGRAFTVGGNQAIVEVALTQLGNEGGQPYWSWYGFDSREEWCACFVSWCAD